MSTLSLWVAEPHPFFWAGTSWNVDDPRDHLHSEVLSKTYDGLIFLEESHAVREVVH
jgi:hypothetical protein